MSSCPSCAFPNSTWTFRPQAGSDAEATCAYCATPLIADTPALLLLKREGEAFSLKLGQRILARSWQDGQLWMIQTVDAEIMTMLSTHHGQPGEEDVEIVVLDGAINLVTALRSITRGASATTSIADAGERTVGRVRDDGCGGLHITDNTGTVLLYAGRRPDDAGSLEVLLTDAGTGRPLVSLFSALVAMEVNGVGPLYRGTVRPR